MVGEFGVDELEGAGAVLVAADLEELGRADREHVARITAAEGANREPTGP